ncbi:hypothetical protein D9615_009380 [Tricholomella constricta]|uniref:HTH CENPB-type domain-containing protein n=1 Tax=Tricholomella constricta TaxID=117010 RepID=A0A8H5LZW4_9AGAR|nr:hypothetical protein D9615_009380 [Tricholomella constricta]
MERQCRTQDNVKIQLSKTTLKRRVQGISSQASSNAQKSWVTDSEADVIINYALKLAEEGWPFSRTRMQEHADEVVRARHGDSFVGVGKCWVDRFVNKHNTHLKACWSRTLDQQRARAGNPVAKEDFFKKLKYMIDGKEDEDPIKPQDIYGTDESGFQDGIGQSERVLGRAGKKGEHFQSTWHQENVLKASLGHQKKGYTDGEIGVEWIKNFDRQTKEKANGRRRLLLVDGHNSHYTRGFLEHARVNQIRVLCYPSHATHLYQGLDVVIFSVLKKRWSHHRDQYERERGHPVKKTNFIKVYALAHAEALTVRNIEAAFEKTGVVPFNPEVITEEMMAPSRTTSIQSILPIAPPSPVRALTDMIHRALARQNMSEDEASILQEQPTDENPLLLTPSRNAVQELASTSASHLVSRTPARSTSTLPRYQPYTISPFKHRNAKLLDYAAVTDHERELQEALKEAEERDERRKHAMISMQATTILHSLYVKKMKVHLEEHEQRKEQKTKKNRIFGDGLAKVLDADEFYNKVVQLEEAAEKAQEEKEERRKRRETHSEALAEWKRQDKVRVERNNERRKTHQEDVEVWQREADQAKAERRRPSKKPQLKDYRIEKALPRPQKPEADEEDEDNDDEEDAGGDEMED